MPTPADETLQKHIDKLARFIKLTARGIPGVTREHGPLEALDVLSGVVVLWEWIPVMLVTIVEAYLIDALTYAAQHDSRFMERSEQSMSYAELRSAASLDDVLTELRDRWARNFVNKGGPQSWVDRLTKMGARGYRPGTAQEMETLWGIRHLIVHRAGVATAEFTRLHPHLGVNVGEEVHISPAQISKWIEHIQDFANVTDTFFLQSIAWGSAASQGLA